MKTNSMSSCFRNRGTILDIQQDGSKFFLEMDFGTVHKSCVMGHL